MFGQDPSGATPNPFAFLSKLFSGGGSPAALRAAAPGAASSGMPIVPTGTQVSPLSITSLTDGSPVMPASATGAMPPSRPKFFSPDGGAGMLGALLLSAGRNPAGPALLQMQNQRAQQRNQWGLEMLKYQLENSKPQLHWGSDDSLQSYDPVSQTAKTILQGDPSADSSIGKNYNFFKSINPAWADQYGAQAAAGPPMMVTMPNGQVGLAARPSFAPSANAPPPPPVGGTYTDPETGLTYKRVKPGLGRDAWQAIGGATPGASPTFP